MKKISILLLFLLFCLSSFCQTTKKEVEKAGFKEKSIDNYITPFASESDYFSMSIKNTIYNNQQKTVNLVILKVNKYGQKVGVIGLKDLKDLVLQIPQLKKDFELEVVDKNKKTNNNYTSPSNMQIGYLVDSQEKKFYIRLDQMDSDNYLFIKDINEVYEKLNEAISKMEMLAK